MNNSFLDQQRALADAEADEIISEYFSQGKQMEVYACLQKSLEDLLESDAKDKIISFIQGKEVKPAWLDPEKIKKGQAFFYKQALPIMTLLGALSLPYCYAGSPGNKALYLSEKMRKSTHKRLLDTADFIINVSKPNALEDTAVGHVYIRKIRLIHAVSRFYILKSGKWDDAWGAPINMEDAAGTNLAFSYLIIRGMQKGGYSISKEEIYSFLHLWKYIGWQMGLDEGLLADTMEDAFKIEYAIRKRHFKYSKEGDVLMKELVEYYKTIVPGEKEAYLMDAQIRYLLGKEVAECVGLMANPLKDAIVKTVNFLRESTIGLTHKTPSFDEMINNQKMLKEKMGVASFN